MTTDPVLSQELKRLLDNVKSEIVPEFPIQVITPNYLILSVLDSRDCDGYSVVSKLMLESSIDDFRKFVTERILKDSSGSIQQDGSPRFSEDYDKIVENLSSSGYQTITSSLMLYSIVSSDDELLKFLVSNGVTKDQLHDVVLAYSNSIDFKNEKSKRKAKKKELKIAKKSDILNPTVRNRVLAEESNMIESSGTNLVRNAESGMYRHIKGYDSVIDEMFAVLGKHERKVVALTGEHGVGKTSVVYQMADMLYRQDCPHDFADKYIIMFEDTISTKIISEMDKSGKYIAFIDDMEKFFINKDVVQTNTFLLSELFKKPNVSTIVTMTDAFFAKNVEPVQALSRHVQRINVQEPKGDRLKEIMGVAMKPYEEDHRVAYSESALEEGVKLARRFVANEKCPKAAVNILDMAGSLVRTHIPENPEISSIRRKLSDIEAEKAMISNSGGSFDYDRKDALVRDEINLKSDLSRLERKADENADYAEISEHDVRNAASLMFGVPVDDLSADDRARLKSLKDRLCAEVVGQDEAVDEVCRAVRRQRVGVSDPNKPVVMLLVGKSGTGKSFLAKRLAYEVFGDENDMVRLDMSEYSDVTSVTKLYGSSAGYVGYEEGGILTESLKKKPRCVLLLDEIEKAHDDVFNVFLQVFDEGRLTDNKGNTVSCKNVIVIMTSNVGTKDVSEKVATIGFGERDGADTDHEIIMKAIKRKFKPEFINRIDTICCFNTLSDDNIRLIIEHEITKTARRIADMGYSLDDSVLHGGFVDVVAEAVKSESEYGARPVLREVRKRLDDRITDLIIDGDAEEGHVFTFDGIYIK